MKAASPLYNANYVAFFVSIENIRKLVMHVINGFISSLVVEKQLNIHQDEIPRLQKYIQQIGYYRFMGYAKSFIDPSTSCFYQQITLQNILDVYIFDRKLRLHILEGLERIEVTFKALLSDSPEISKNDPFYYHQRSNFPDVSDYAWEYFNKQLDKEVKSNTTPTNGADGKKNREQAFDQFYAKNPNKKYPYSWIMFQALSFGTITRFATDILSTDARNIIASKFNLKSNVLHSWLRMLSDLRNVCAHHSRCWNFTFGSLPTKLKNSLYLDISEYMHDNTVDIRSNKLTQLYKLTNNAAILKIINQAPLTAEDEFDLKNLFITDVFESTNKQFAPFHFAIIQSSARKKLYHQLAVVWFFIRQISPTSEWVKRLQNLITEYPVIEINKMGFPSNWTEDKFWQL